MRNWWGRLALAGLVVVGSTAALTGGVRIAQAQTDTSAQTFINGQYYNQPISDGDFTNIGTMSANDVQNFLAGKGSGLATINSSQLGAGANGRSAAQIIYDAAHANDSASSGTANGICITNNPSSCPGGDDAVNGTINPEAIMMTLQKEQSLITTASPSQGALDAAMGYGCPDSGGCNPTYAGFTNQVGWAAWELRYDYERSRLGYASVSPYIIGNSLPNMTYNFPDVGLSGSVTVYLSDNATATLYRYTPHIGGNYNFWKLGITWFGFNTSGGGGNPGNDTTALQAGTYDASFVVSSTKVSADSVVFNGQTVAGSGSTSWKLTIAPALGTNAYTVNYLDSNGNNDGSKTITIDRRLVGDINGDGKVNVLDLSIMFSNWNQTVQGDNWASLSNVNDWMSLNPDVDNTINILDLSLMFAHWTG